MDVESKEEARQFLNTVTFLRQLGRIYYIEK